MAYDDGLTAHDRFMLRRKNFIESNPGAVSKLERESTLDHARRLEERDAMNKRDLEMLKQQAINAVNLEEQHGITLRDQGKGSAEINLQGILDANERNFNLETKRLESQASQVDKQILQDQELAKLKHAHERGMAADRNETDLKIATMRAEESRNNLLAQQNMQKYRIDENNATRLAIVQKQLEGKDDASKIAIIKAAVSSYQLDPAVAQQQIDEILGKKGGQPTQPRSTSTWERKK